MAYYNKQNDFEEEPPSYDHAFQTNLETTQVYQYGKYQDASVDSFERGEMFIQAFHSQIDSFPLMQAQEVGTRGLLNCLGLDTSIQHNELFKHPRTAQNGGTLAYTMFAEDVVQFWPSINTNKPLEDYDTTIQATHPFLLLNEYKYDSNYAHLQNLNHYFEITILQASPAVVMAIGLSTRPYPLFRMPGWNKFSVGYHSDDGHKFCDDATGGQPFGPSWSINDVLGCGYCPENGNVFFTKNGQFLGYAFQGLKKHAYFASIGVDGPATVKINFGREAFVYQQLENWIGQYV